MTEKFRALLASARIANAPSAVSNVVLGYALGLTLSGESDRFDGFLVALFAIMAVCLLVAGNLINDWYDRDWDATHRPERALPSGLFSPPSYLIMAVGTAIAALAIAGALGIAPAIVTALILVCIGGYTAMHKRSPWSVLPMGLCRAGLYVLGFVCAWPSGIASDGAFEWLPALVLATHALGLLSYVAGLSLTARYESMPHPPAGRKRFAHILLWLPLIAMTAWWADDQPWASGLALIPFILWLGWSLALLRQSVPKLVSAMLAGIPLVDFIATAPLAMRWLNSAATPPSTAIGLMMMPIAAWLFGLALQKIASAT